MNHTAVCIFNEGHQVSLKLGKEYVLIPDEMAEYHERFRIVDETGESYLFPKSFFIRLLPGTDLERISFEQWATENLGQGYPLTMDEHDYQDRVTRWAFKAWKAGRQQLRSENA
jgi:hypothetical protein